MKKIGVYLLGIVSGVVLTFLISLVINRSRNSDISFFDEPGEILTAEHFGENGPVKNLKVFQVLEDGVALAAGDEWFSSDLIVLLWNEEGKPYHDNQNVIASNGNCFRQIGIYKYKSKDKMHRTVPVVMLMDGEFEEFIEEPSITEKRNNNYTFFETPGDMMSDNSYKVDRVLDDGSAIAKGKGDWYNKADDFYPGLEVLLLDDGSCSYYNDQIIKAPTGKRFRQIGIYKSGFKTLPIVKLMDK